MPAEPRILAIAGDRRLWNDALVNRSGWKRLEGTSDAADDSSHELADRSESIRMLSSATVVVQCTRGGVATDEVLALARVM